MKLKKKSQSEPLHSRWVGGPGPGPGLGPGGDAATSAAVVGARPPLGEAGGMMALKRLHVLVLLQPAALAGAGEPAGPPRRGERGRGRPSRRSPAPAPARPVPPPPPRRAPGAAPGPCRPLYSVVCLCRAAPRADLHRAARRVLIETLPRVFRPSGRGEEAPIKTKISCFNGLLN